MCAKVSYQLNVYIFGDFSEEIWTVKIEIVRWLDKIFSVKESQHEVLTRTDDRIAETAQNLRRDHLYASSTLAVKKY